MRVLLLLLVIPAALCHPGLHRASTAEAHPGTAQLGQRLEIDLRPGTGDGTDDGTPAGLGVSVAYVAEIPSIRIYAEARTANDPDYAEHRRQDLAGGIAVSWNGEKVPITVVPAGETPGGALIEAPGDMIELHIYATGTLPGREGTLKVLNRNFPDEGGYFATSVLVDGSLVVTGTSLTQVRDGHVYRNHHGAWLRDETAREPVVSVRPATWWEQRTGEFPLPERLDGLDTLKPPVVGLAVGSGAAVVILGGGLAWVLRRRRRHDPRNR